MFDFLKKDSGQAPPDVGDEDVFDEENAEPEDEEKKEVKMPGKLKKKDVSIPETVPIKDSVAVGSASLLEIEKIKGQIESVVAWINQFYERFSYVSENIGELRAMNVANEKKIFSATKEAERVIDIVKEVKPEALRLDYQKVDMRVKTFEEREASNRQFVEDVMKEVSDIRKKSEIFVGTDALIKLNEDIKKDLIEAQKLSLKTKMQADKSHEIFMELKRGFADFQKLSAIVDNFSNSYSGLREEIEKVRLDHETVVSYATFADFKKTFGNKISVLDGAIEDLDNIKKNNEVFGKTMENLFSIVRRNKQDIGDVAIKSGKTKVKSIEEYNNQIIELLDVVNTLTTQVAELRKKAGIGKNIPLKKKLVADKTLGTKVVPVAKKKILKKQKVVSEERDIELEPRKPKIDRKKVSEVKQPAEEE
ncbi:hypothetical protein KAT36_00695 [Candidatus Pacearchaeota archaeon]|nr:hypothetical protein [Candidatus Pacearchaeota archaeon]